MVYSTIMVLQKQLASEQSKSTENTNKAAQRLLDYLSKHPKIIIRYHVSQINRPVHSDTLHPLVPKWSIHIGGYFFPGNDKKFKNAFMHNGDI